MMPAWIRSSAFEHASADDVLRLVELPPWSGRLAIDAPERQELARVAASRPIFLREVMEWDLARSVCCSKFWFRLTCSFNTRSTLIDLTDPEGRPVAFSRPGVDRGSYRLELYPSGDAPEPMAELELADTQFNQIEVVWVALQNPSAPRFDTDVIAGGEASNGGTKRNLVAEEAAMLAGLAPGQVRRGLGALRWLAERVETVMLCLNQRELIVQPLFYHTAVLFEQLGFSYIHGLARMTASRKVLVRTVNCVPGLMLQHPSDVPNSLRRSAAARGRFTMGF